MVRELISTSYEPGIIFNESVLKIILYESPLPSPTSSVFVDAESLDASNTRTLIFVPSDTTATLGEPRTAAVRRI
jgi:hypothetical protein